MQSREEIFVTLRSALVEIRRQGWAENVNESELGAASIAAPVRNERGEVIAALSIVGPVQRLGSDSLRRFARPAVDAAMAVSRRLGYRDPRTPRRSAGESTP